MAIWMIIGIALLVVAAIAAVVILCIVKYSRDHILDGPGMIRESEKFYLNYYHGGSSNGDSYSLTVNDGKLTYSKCEAAGMPEIKGECELEVNITERILSILYACGIRKWKKLPQSDIVAMDAASTSFQVTFADGVDIRVGNNDIPPEGGWKKIMEIVEILEQQME